MFAVAIPAGSVIHMNKTRKRKTGFEHWHLIFILLVIYDIIAVNLS